MTRSSFRSRFQGPGRSLGRGGLRARRRPLLERFEDRTLLSAFFTEAPGTPIAVGTHPEEIVVGDFNGDGILDLATANSGGIATPPRGNVSILLGNGDGTFTESPGSPIEIGSPAWTLVSTDLDEDGNLDLIVGARGEGGRGVTVLMGQGMGRS